MPKIEAKYTDYLQETIDVMGHGGILLAAQDAEGKPNAMTIGWGTIGIIWSKPIFIVLVRPSRYTYDLIEGLNDFTVNVPPPELKDEVLFCGTVSGRDRDKFAEKKLKKKRSNGKMESLEKLWPRLRKGSPPLTPCPILNWRGFIHRWSRGTGITIVSLASRGNTPLPGASSPPCSGEDYGP